MKKVDDSILAAGISGASVIPNGVDLSVFHPGDKEAARSALGVPTGVRMLLFAANGIRFNIWKDYRMMRSAVELVASKCPRDQIVFVAIGENAPRERIGNAVVQFVPYNEDPSTIARYYQAADVYMHAARADNFPLTVLEAMACGSPVVATAVGGIPEQVEHGRSGFLVSPADAAAMAEAIEALLSDETLNTDFSAYAARAARERFDLNRQVDAYLTWYQKILET